MAELFVAYDRQIEPQLVALKRVLPQLASQVEFLEMFLDEARIAATLHHHNIVPVIDLGHIEADDSYYLALPYIEGTELGLLGDAARQNAEPLSPEEAAWAALQICRGLDYAHDKTGPDGSELGIVHRDISPPNVLVSSAGDVFVTDFGIARAVQKVSVTRAGEIKGKLGYASPEMLEGQRVDRRHDIFGTGILLWELIAGRALFTGANEEELGTRVRQAKVPAFRDLRPGVPKELEEIVRKSLRADRDHRYQLASQMADDLSRWLHSRGFDEGQTSLARKLDRYFGPELRARKVKLEQMLMNNNLPLPTSGWVAPPEEKTLRVTPPQLVPGPSPWRRRMAVAVAFATLVGAGILMAWMASG
jgi:serine/threonine-protein kinase